MTIKFIEISKDISEKDFKLLSDIIAIRSESDKKFDQGIIYDCEEDLQFQLTKTINEVRLPKEREHDGEPHRYFLVEGENYLLDLKQKKVMPIKYVDFYQPLDEEVRKFIERYIKKSLKEKPQIIYPDFRMIRGQVFYFPGGIAYSKTLPRRGLSANEFYIYAERKNIVTHRIKLSDDKFSLEPIRDHIDLREDMSLEQQKLLFETINQHLLQGDKKKLSSNQMYKVTMGGKEHTVSLSRSILKESYENGEYELILKGKYERETLGRGRYGKVTFNPHELGLDFENKTASVTRVAGKTVVKTIQRNVGEGTFQDMVMDEYKFLKQMELIEKPPIFRKKRDNKLVAYLRMKKIDGVPLPALISEGKLSDSLWIKVLYEIAVAVKKVHDRGIVHGDIKARNLIVTLDPKSKKVSVTVIDFGIARAKETGGSQKSDIYLLGFIFDKINKHISRGHVAKLVLEKLSHNMKNWYWPSRRPNINKVVALTRFLYNSSYEVRFKRLKHKLMEASQLLNDTLKDSTLPKEEQVRFSEILALVEEQKKAVKVDIENENYTEEAYQLHHKALKKAIPDPAQKKPLQSAVKRSLQLISSLPKSLDGVILPFVSSFNVKHYDVLLAINHEIKAGSSKTPAPTRSRSSSLGG